jgi:GT2 family glycosyltransferase
MLNQISVIIPTMKGREELLSKLLSYLPTEVEAVIVDDEDLLLAAKRNKGARKAHGEYFLFADDDNFFEAGSIGSALKSIEQPGVGIVGFMACYDNDPNHVADGGSKRNYLTGFTYGVNTNNDWNDLVHVPYEVDEIANVFMIHRELFYELYGFDEVNFPIDLDEADLCKRVKNRGLRIIMDPLALCFHKSITYSPIPNFRRKLNAYTMGNHRIRFQRKHLNALSYRVYLVIFMPLFVGFYTLSLIWKNNLKMILPFLHGVIDGIRNCRTNKYK